MNLDTGPVIHQRAAFSHALIDGKAVTEFEPTGKAAIEITILWKWIDGKKQTN